MSYYKRTTCRLCDSTHLTLALHYPPQPLADDYRSVMVTGRLAAPDPKYPLDLYLCTDCGCAQLLDVVSADEIYPSYTYETGSSPALVEHFRQYAVELDRRLKPLPGQMIIDIGGNDGTLLNFFRLAAVRRIIVDPAPVKQAPSVLYYKQFFDADLANRIHRGCGPAHIITANNVYANIDDLRTFTEAVRNLLAPDGVFVFETFYLADFLGVACRDVAHLSEVGVFDFIYHEHLTAFALSPLVGFFQRLGMQVFDVQRVATKGGSIRVYVQHDSGKRPVSSDVAALVEWEYLRGLHKIKTFKRFAEKINVMRQHFVETKRLLPGKTWAGYGASPTSTTLIYSWNLKLDYLIDDWPGKQGTFSPGLHLPVYGPEILTDEVKFGVSADYCIILAWRYADQIMARNPHYRGTWIVPLPELRIINANTARKQSAIS
jgi:SAM-dependent methyltransferase